MSELPINKRVGEMAGAPTPQNTPSSAAPISSHAAEPKVPTIDEAESEKIDRAAAANLLIQNPAFINMVQGRLSGLVGKSSGYIENLPPVVKRRIEGLKGVQKQHSKLESEFQEEVLLLEKKYFEKFTPLYQKRATIVNGEAEPTDAEVEAGKEEDDAEMEDADKKAVDKDTTKDVTDVKGIPEFWLTAMKNHPTLAETITDRDESALKHLTDIRMEYLDKPGFRLIFVFAPNEHFTNKTISKTYFYQEENGYGGDFIYDHAEGQKIEWKGDKDLTVRIETKKQRNKTTKQTRVVRKTVPCESFFNFFTPPTAPSEDDEPDEDIEERLELDYSLGEDIKEKLIPRAIDWFTGEALRFEDGQEFDEEEEFDDDDDEDNSDDDQEDDDDEDESDEGDEAGKSKKQDAAECKQS